MTRWKIVGLAVPALVGILLLAANGQPGPIPSAPNQIQPILIGSEAPGPVLENASGEAIDLSQLLEQRPTILVFYRAHW